MSRNIILNWWTIDYKLFNWPQYTSKQNTYLYQWPSNENDKNTLVHRIMDINRFWNKPYMYYITQLFTKESISDHS